MVCRSTLQVQYMHVMECYDMIARMFLWHPPFRVLRDLTQLLVAFQAPLRRFGFSIDGQGFPHLLQVVKVGGTVAG